MRKSVVIGLGLWVLAVASVAAIAWLAIETAGSQVTAVAVTAPVPSLSSSPAPVTQSARTAPVPWATPSTTTASAQRPAVRAYFGSISTDGGRVRARCISATVSLEGGFARPEPGWRVRVHPDNPNLWVMFGSQSRAIAVLATCADGRPTFMQQSQSLSKGGALPAPSPSIQDAPAPLASTPPPVTPGPTALPFQGPPVQPLQRLLDPVTPSMEATQPDPAQVAAYVSAQNDMCAQSGWSTDWCRNWRALSDQERYAQALQWLTSLLKGGDAAGPTGTGPTGDVSTGDGQSDDGPGPLSR